MSSRRNSFLTPCRQVGLKRKSICSTPPITENITTQQQRSTPSSVNIVNDGTESQITAKTPSSEQRPVVSKRFKRSVTLPTPTKSEKESTPLKNIESVLTTENDELISKTSSMSPPSVSRIESLPLHTHTNDELSLSDIQSKINQIRERISAARTQIDALQSQSMNAKQHDLETLNHLILKWRHSCQNALNELVREYSSRNRPCSIPDLLQSIGIPAKLVRYSNVEMDFYE